MTSAAVEFEIITVPEETGITPSKTSTSEDFPEPDGPTIATDSPGVISKLTPLSTWSLAFGELA